MQRRGLDVGIKKIIKKYKIKKFKNNDIPVGNLFFFVFFKKKSDL